MRLIAVCASVLLLAGCAESTLTRSGALSGSGASSPRPKTIVVSDLKISPDLTIVDRGFTTRLERKIGAFPTFERKQRTVERVNDEIVATLIATLRESGLDAQPGSEEGLSLSEASVLVSGSLRGTDAGKSGIGEGKSGAVAEMSLSSLGGFGKKQLLSFSAEPAGGRLPAGRQAAAGNALIAAALASNKAAPEKLSPDVESAARRIGRSAGEKIVAYGKTAGWYTPALESVADAPNPDLVKPEPVAVPEAAAPEAVRPATPAPVAAAPAAPKPVTTLASARPEAAKTVARTPAPRATRARAPAPEMIPDDNTELDTTAPAGD